MGLWFHQNPGIPACVKPLHQQTPCEVENILCSTMLTWATYFRSLAAPALLHLEPHTVSAVTLLLHARGGGGGGGGARGAPPLGGHPYYGVVVLWRGPLPSDGLSGAGNEVEKSEQSVEATQCSRSPPGVRETPGMRWSFPDTCWKAGDP